MTTLTIKPTYDHVDELDPSSWNEGALAMTRVLRSFSVYDSREDTHRDTVTREMFPMEQAPLNFLGAAVTGKDCLIREFYGA